MPDLFKSVVRNQKMIIVAVFISWLIGVTGMFILLAGEFQIFRRMKHYNEELVQMHDETRAVLKETQAKLDQLTAAKKVK